jgi:adenine-specific DNA glycosylase
MGVKLSGSDRGDLAYEADLRRVMLRSGLADFDDVEHMTMSIASLNPDDPGSLDPALLAIGALWCHQVDPACHACAIGEHCPKIIEPGGGTPQLSADDDNRTKSTERTKPAVEETSPSEDSLSF